MGNALSWKSFAKNRDVEELHNRVDSLQKSVNNFAGSLAEVSVAANQIMDGINAVHDELKQIRNELRISQESHQSLRMTIESSSSSVERLLEHINKNALTKEDMKVLESFLRFIAANQLALDGVIYGEAESASNVPSEEHRQ